MLRCARLGNQTGEGQATSMEHAGAEGVQNGCSAARTFVMQPVTHDGTYAEANLELQRMLRRPLTCWYAVVTTIEDWNLR